MPRYLVVLAIAGLFAPLWVGADARCGIEVTDDSGAVVKLLTPARRIITLSPHAAELVFAAGAGAYVVGVVEFTDYPPPAANIPHVGDAAHLDRESLLALHPDLIIAWPSGNRPQDLAWLQRQGLALYRSDPATLEAIGANLVAIGQLSHTATALAAATAYTARLAQLRRRYAHTSTHAVFYQVWATPLITLGPQHLLSQVLQLCGGRPLFPTLVGSAAVVSKEAVILADPYAIIADATIPGSDAFAFWHRWPSLNAVRNRRLISIASALLQRPTPRILEGTAQLCAALARGSP